MPCAPHPHGAHGIVLIHRISLVIRPPSASMRATAIHEEVFYGATRTKNHAAHHRRDGGGILPGKRSHQRDYSGRRGRGLSADDGADAHLQQIPADHRSRQRRQQLLPTILVCEERQRHRWHPHPGARRTGRAGQGKRQERLLLVWRGPFQRIRQFSGRARLPFDGSVQLDGSGRRLALGEQKSRIDR